ncbi:MAG: potassium efflux system protein [Pirellulaceae bacterium]
MLAEAGVVRFRQVWYFFAAITSPPTAAKSIMKLSLNQLSSLLLTCCYGFFFVSAADISGGLAHAQLQLNPPSGGGERNGGQPASEQGPPLSQNAAVPAVEAGDNLDTSTDAATVAGSAQRLAAAEAQLERAKQVAENNGTDVPGSLQREVDLRKRTQGTLAQQESAKSQSQELTKRLEQVNAALETLREVGPDYERPYSFLLLDHLRDELASQNNREATADATLQSSEAAVIRGKEVADQKEKQLRLAKEGPQNGKDPAEIARLKRIVEEEELAAKLANDVLTLRRMERSNEQLQQTVLQAEVEMLKEKVRWIEKSAVFSREDLQDQAVELDKRESDLQDLLRAAEFNLQFAVVELSETRKQVEGTTQRSSDLRERLASKQTTRQLYQTQVSLLNARLQRLTTDRETWNRRFRVITGEATAEQTIEWGGETANWLEQLEREQRLEKLRVDQLRQEMAGVETKLQAAEDSAGNTRAWIEIQRDRLTELILAHDACVVGIEGSRRLHEKLRTEISGNRREWSFGEWFAWAGHYFGQMWNTEIARVDERPITVGKVLVGILLIFFGFVLSRMLAKILGKRMRAGRIRMHESGAAAVQQLSFYVLFVCFSLTALRFVNVPLTMFTFLGGAIAIGVGLGSQNIINNFISGLVLLAERPIKVGDLIQLNELYGNVEEIGARSTRIRTGENLEIIVPNSRFLEADVVNLTLGDNRLRTKVGVGVAYGSPTREVQKLLLKAAAEHSRVLNSPESFVWFSDFADNSLNFELHVWVRVRTFGERLTVESDLRFHIEELFREAKIEIAFPQRDIHVNTVKPIEVKWVESNERAA